MQFEVYMRRKGLPAVKTQEGSFSRVSDKVVFQAYRDLKITAKSILNVY